MFLLVSHCLGVWWTHRILGFFKERKLNPKSNLNQPDACWEKRGCYQGLAKCQQMCFPSHTDHPLKTEPDRADRVGRRITPAMSLLVLPVCIYYSCLCCCVWFVLRVFFPLLLVSSLIMKYFLGLVSLQLCALHLLYMTAPFWTHRCVHGLALPLLPLKYDWPSPEDHW